MKRLIIYGAAIWLVTGSISLAAIINIPDDYGTIQEGIDNSADRDTVLVQPGIYYENINFNGHNIVLGSLFLITEDSSYIDQTIIDGNGSGSVVTFNCGENNMTIINGFTIRNGQSSFGGGIYCNSSNPVIANNKILHNHAYDSMFAWGGGIYCYNSNPIIRNNVIQYNTLIGQYGAMGAGIFCSCCPSAIIIGNIISDNNANYNSGGGGITCLESPGAVISNNIIARNIAESGGGIEIRGGLAISNNVITRNRSGLGNEGGLEYIGANPDSTDAIIYNNIFWADSGLFGAGEINIYQGEPSITYCNIQDTLWPGEGNISVNPLFRNPELGDFHLMAIECGDSIDSPCIDMGDPDILDSLVDCLWGIGSERSDMGAFGGGEGWVGIEYAVVNIPQNYMLLQNYPNPFNASTVIEFDLPESQHVSITIYNLLGREVATLFDGVKPAGEHSLFWAADKYPSGMYFYKLQVGEHTESKKMLLLK